MIDKITKFVKTIGSLDIKKIVTILTLIGMISGGIFWLQATYVSANDFKVYAASNDYQWAKLQLERITDQIYYWMKKLDENPNDAYAQKKLRNLYNEEQLLLDKIKMLEKRKGS